MSSERHLSRHHVPASAPQPDEGFSTVSQQSPMATQAAGFAAVGSAAHASCRRGANAEKELTARGQQSGQ